MYNPLFWIEWLDRLDRVLTGARQDVAVLKRAVNPRSLEAIDRSKRQLSALMNDLRLNNRPQLRNPGGIGSETSDNGRAAAFSTGPGAHCGDALQLRGVSSRCRSEFIHS